MKIIALEEHLSIPAADAAWEAAGLDVAHGGMADALAEVGEARLAAMDDQGVDVQVLSLTAPGFEQLSPQTATEVARTVNDRVAAIVAAHPDRFEGFVNLPTPDPAAAAEELRRGVRELGFRAGFLNGRVGEGTHVDHPDLDPVWAAAAELHTPIYIHPQAPPTAVQEAYYSGLGDPQADWMFAHAGLGWHYETGIQLLRLIYGRVFDRHPELQVVVGHWGEVVLFFAERIANLDRAMDPPLERPLLDYLRQNVSYTPSGILSPRYLDWTVDLVGIERLMFSVDFPYIPGVGGGAARRFLEEAPLSDADRQAVAHGNWERLTAAAG